MRLLTKAELKSALADANPDSLFLDPILADDQIGAITVDLRLGCDFLVSILTRKPAIEPSPVNQDSKRGIHSYFQETRRRVGDRFVLYPHQIVLSTTLEFLSLPTNVFAEVAVRSSYARLGVGANTTIQPGWRGAVPLELFNHGNSPIDMVVGSRICQIKFYQIDDNVNYVDTGLARKYFGAVRPSVSRADKDSELEKLTKISKLD